MLIPTTSRRLPLKRTLDVDESVAFKQSDILTFKTLHENCPEGYQVLREDHKSMFYRIGKQEFLIPEVTECIVVDSELHVKLFLKGSPVALPQWFCKGSDCRLTKKSALENFSTYI